jgi:hypothetical protein
VVCAEGNRAKDIVSFHRSNDFDHIGEEVRKTRDSVGVTEIANFAKYEVTGTGSEAFLNHLMTNKMPKKGRIVLTPMLNEFGKLIGDFTIAKAGDDRFIIWGSSRGAKIPHALVRAAPAQGWVGAHSPLRPDAGRPVDRRAEQPEAAAETGRRRRVVQSVPVHGFPRDGGRRRAVHGQPHHLYRRSRL